MKTYYLKSWPFQIITLSLIGLALFTWFQSLNLNIVGVDGYYHIRLAQIMKQDFIIDRLPQAKLTIFNEQFADKEFLFHVLLMPFAGNYLITGAKFAVIIFNIALLVTIYGILRSSGVHWALFAALCLPALSSSFWYQILLPRAHLLSMILVLWAIWSMHQNRKKTLAFLCCMEALSYTAWHLIPGLAMIYVFITYLQTKILNLRLFLAALLGAFIGLVIHPHPFVTIKLWYNQNILFFYHRFFSEVQLPKGTEFDSLSFNEMIQLFPLELIFVVIGFFLWFFSLRGSWVIWGIMAVVFGFMTKGSIKFCHYWSPICLIWASIAIYHYFKNLKILNKTIEKKLFYVFFLTLILGMCYLSKNNFHHYRNLALYAPNLQAQEILALNQFVPQNSFVFNCDWFNTPELFFHRPDLSFPIILDPIFAYYGNPEGYSSWKTICSNMDTSLPGVFLKKLKADYALIKQNSKKVIQKFFRDPEINLIWQNNNYALFQVL